MSLGEGIYVKKSERLELSYLIYDNPYTLVYIYIYGIDVFICTVSLADHLGVMLHIIHPKTYTNWGWTKDPQVVSTATTGISKTSIRDHGNP